MSRCLEVGTRQKCRHVSPRTLRQRLSSLVSAQTTEIVINFKPCHIPGPMLAKPMEFPRASCVGSVHTPAPSDKTANDHD